MTPAPTRWADVETAAPDLAASIRRRFEAHLHHVLATLRADGSPRVSGTEVRFDAGELCIGMMPGSRKLDDVRRDPRVALHAAPIDVELAKGDAKVEGDLVEVTDEEVRRRVLQPPDTDAPPLDGAVLRLAPRSVVLTQVAGDHLVIRSWTADGGERKVERR